MPLRKQEKSSRSSPLYIPRQKKTTVKSLHTDSSWCYINLSVKITLAILGHCLKKVSSMMYLLKKVSMKMPSFPILSWSVSSKSSRVTKSSSCKSKGGKMWVDLSHSSPYSNPSSTCGSSRKDQPIVQLAKSSVRWRDIKCFIYT